MNSLVSLHNIRENLTSARNQSASAESCFKSIEGTSDNVRKSAANIDTYQARHDEEGKDVSDEGKAAVRALRGVAGKQGEMQGLHSTEEAARRQLQTDLSVALGESKALQVPPPDKDRLLYAISNAQQTDQAGNWHYTAVDTALYAAGLQLPNAQEYADIVAGDDKSRDVRLQGEYLQSGLEKLQSSYSDAAMSADRSEFQQDRVGSHVESALQEVDRLENRALRPYYDDAYAILEAQMQPGGLLRKH